MDPLTENQKKEQGLIALHRTNLEKGPYINEDGTMTTINIVGITGPNGKVYNIPGYSHNSGPLTDQEAGDLAAAQGWENFPSYNSGPEANEAAARLHQTIEQDGRQYELQNMDFGLFDDDSFDMQRPSWRDGINRDMEKGGYRGMWAYRDDRQDKFDLEQAKKFNPWEDPFPIPKAEEDQTIGDEHYYSAGEWPDFDSPEYRYKQQFERKFQMYKSPGGRTDPALMQKTL